MSLHFAIMIAEGFCITCFLSMCFTAIAANSFMASSTIKHCLTHDTCKESCVPAFVLWFLCGGVDIFTFWVFAHMIHDVTYWGSFLNGASITLRIRPPFTENICTLVNMFFVAQTHYWGTTKYALRRDCGHLLNHLGNRSRLRNSRARYRHFIYVTIRKRSPRFMFMCILCFPRVSNIKGHIIIEKRLVCYVLQLSFWRECA